MSKEKEKIFGSNGFTEAQTFYFYKPIIVVITISLSDCILIIARKYLSKTFFIKSFLLALKFKKIDYSKYLTFIS